MKVTETIRAGLEMYSSLIQAIDEAGGTWEMYTMDEILNMPLIEIIGKLATNNIRFIYVKKG